MKKMTLLFPGSYMDYRKIDEDMQEEYRAAVETGLYHTQKGRHHQIHTALSIVDGC